MLKKQLQLDLSTINVERHYMHTDAYNYTDWVAIIIRTCSDCEMKTIVVLLKMNE